MVASWVLVGSLVPGGGLPAGMFCTYRSSSPSLEGGKGDPTGGPGHGGDPPRLPPAPPTAGSGGSGGSSGLDGGTAARLCLRVGGAGASRIGLQRTGRIGSGGGTAGAIAELVLGGLTGLRQSCNGSGDGALAFCDPGRGI